MNKENEKIFSIVAFFLMLTTLILSTMNNVFIPAFLSMLSLFIFSICYIIKDTRKKTTYVLFAIGVLLIIATILYLFSHTGIL